MKALRGSLAIQVTGFNNLFFTSPEKEFADGTLVICDRGTNENLTGSSGVKRIRVADELEQLTTSEHDDIYRALSNLRVNSYVQLPIHEIAWQNLISTRQGRLLDYVLFAVRLSEIVESYGPKEIVCLPSVDRGFTAVTRDIGRSMDVPVRRQIGLPMVLIDLQRALVTSVLVIPFLVDQFLSLLISAVHEPDGEADVLFVPALLRLDSMLPVLERTPFDFDVLIASKVSSWTWWLRHSELDSFDPTPISAFTSLGCMLRQLSTYVGLVKFVFMDDTYKREIRAGIRNDVGVELDRSIQVSIQKAFRTRVFISMLIYVLFAKIVADRSWNTTVFGTLSPAGRAIERASLANGASAFHIPHSIMTGYAPNPSPELTEFVSGKIDVEFVRRSKQVQDQWNMVVTGRPYLTELYSTAEDYRDETPSSGGGVTLLVATQPMRQRFDFVSSIVEAVRDTGLDADVVIKPHPSEDGNDYAEFSSEYGFVSVSEDDIHASLLEADLTLTINSNVGLESVIVGTPSVCVNRWSPVVPTPPFAQYREAIPVFSNEEELRTFMDELDEETLDEMQRAQETFVHEGYVLTEDAVENIVDYLDESAEQR